jgi:hypothetical protein
MAYLSIEPFDYAPSISAGAVAPLRLSPVERSVVYLSLHDSRQSLRPLSRAGRLLRGIFGIRPTTRLADPKLEALRSYAVSYRTMRRDATHGADAVIQTGDLEHGAEAIAEARRIVDAQLAPLPRRRLDKVFVAWMVAIAVIVWFAFQMLTRELGDPLVSSILVGVAAVTVVSFTRPRHGLE